MKNYMENYKTEIRNSQFNTPSKHVPVSIEFNSKLLLTLLGLVWIEFLFKEVVHASRGVADFAFMCCCDIS